MSFLGHGHICNLTVFGPLKRNSLEIFQPTAWKTYVPGAAIRSFVDPLVLLVLVLVVLVDLQKI